MTFRTLHLLLTKISYTLLILSFASAISAQEICDNRIDDDGDGLIDCMDPDCSNHNSCWECSTEFYQVHSNTTVVSLDPVNGTYTQVSTISGAEQINGAQMNPLDGHVYAPTKINNVHTLGMLNRDGSVVDLGFTLNSSNIFYAGAIDIDGYFYVGRGGQNLEKIDLGATPLTAVATNIPWPGVADMAYDKVNNLFYGINGSAKLVVIDPAAETVNNYDLAGAVNSVSGGFGAAWSSSDGSFFASNNSSGKIFSIDIANLQSTEVINATGNLSINDGFNCFNAKPPFESNCSNGIDDDGDGLVDCDDPDCAGSTNCLSEICDNGIDDDGDGLVDCDDPECQVCSTCLEICDNGIDDNGNGLIDEEDSQCAVSTAKDGGLESNRRMAEKIAKRNFGKVKENYTVAGRDELTKFTSITSIAKSNPGIEDLIPADAIDGAEFYVNSPSDLIDITNAEEVFAVDVFMLDRRVASILALTTNNKVYEHTKYICDRLNGASLLDISSAQYHGTDFLTAEILQADGAREYVMSFSTFQHNGKHNVENYWNLDRYSKGKRMYNFQIWADSPEHLNTLAEAILSKLENNGGVASMKSMKAPSLFVQNGVYQNGKLRLNIKNKKQASQLRIVGSKTASETAFPKNVDQLIDLNRMPTETLEIELGSVFDIGFRLEHGADEYFDDLFLADGVWGVDVANGGILHDFDVNDALGGEQSDVKLSLERNPSLDVTISSTASIYRSLKPNFRSVDLADFNVLNFESDYDQDIEVTLVKSSIGDWANQPKAILESSGNGSYSLRLDNVFNANSERLSLDDIQAVLFTIKNEDENAIRKQIEIRDVRFEMDLSLTNISLADANTSMAFPNPVIDRVNLIWEEAETTQTEIRVLNNLGQMVDMQIINTVKGINEYSLSMKPWETGVYYYSILSKGQAIKSGKLTKI